jgi:hypothetical protein
MSNLGGCVQATGAIFSGLTSGNKAYTLSANTEYAGGTGSGSTASLTDTVVVNGDPLASVVPGATFTAPLFTVTPTLIFISGVQYATTGTQFTIPQGKLTLTNLYFLDKGAGGPPSASIESELPYAATALDLTSSTTIYYNNPGPIDGLAEAGSGSTSNPFGQTYFNKAWTYTTVDASGTAYTTSATNVLDLATRITNGKGAVTTITTNDVPLGYNYYGNAAINEVLIRSQSTINDVPVVLPPGVVAPTSNSINRIIRLRNVNGLQQPPISDMIQVSPVFTTLSSNETVLNPYTGFLETNSVLKYLTFLLEIKTLLSSFTINLGTSGTVDTINPASIFLKWSNRTSTTPSTTESIWFNANVATGVLGIGCGSGSVPGGRAENIPISRPTAANIFSGQHTVYVVIGYTGTIKMSEINVI